MQHPLEAVLFLKSKKLKLMRFLDFLIVVFLASVYSPSGKLLKKLTTPYLQVLPILLTVYISFFLLSALLRICTSVSEDIRIHCQLVRYNCTKTLLLIDACLVILSDDLTFRFLLCVLLISLFILPFYVCVRIIKRYLI